MKRFLLFLTVAFISISSNFCQETQEEKPPEIPVQKEKKYFASKDEIKKNLFALDFSYLLNGLKNNGWGLGFRYEQYFGKHFAGQVHFGHSTFIIENNFFPSVSLGLFAEIYPFREGLDGFYIALGGCFDFIALSLIPNVPEGTKQEYLSVYPFLGYKLRIFKWLSADFFCGYKKVFFNADEEAKKKLESYIGSGVKVGVSLRFHFF